jgi:hypothetical protein
VNNKVKHKQSKQTYVILQDFSCKSILYIVSLKIERMFYHAFEHFPRKRFSEINSMPCGKANGLYSCPMRILKCIKENISWPLAEIMNLSIQNGVFPSKLKLAKVIPVYIRMTMRLIQETTGQFHCFLISVKYLKN